MESEFTCAAADIRRRANEWADIIRRRGVVAADVLLGDEFALLAPGLGVLRKLQWLGLIDRYVVES